jgi:hypothetical protein
MLFADFHRCFQDWLPASERATWSKQETGRELKQLREVFYGNGNVRMISDIAFEKPYPHVVQREDVERGLRVVKFIDDEIGFVVRNGDTWTRIEPDALRDMLAVIGLRAPQTYAIKAAARANPVSLSDLLDRDSQQPSGCRHG